MKENNIINTSDIKNLIYTIRGKEVMLDSDLARLYKCVNGTKTVNLAVKRHPNKFPKRFMFQLTKEEYKILRFQLETTNNMSRSLPYVFTEQGVAMLATILKSSVATEVSIAIMNAFVLMRHFMLENQDTFKSIVNINNKLDIHEEKIKLLFSKFETKELTEKIFFNGSIYDAYSKILDIMNKAHKELIIIDNYADKSVLDMVSKLKVNVILIVKTKPLLTETDIKKYNEEYHNLKIIYNDSFHDRYLILDQKEIYHLGASLNYAGSKTFSINKLQDDIIKNLLIDNVNNIIKEKISCEII